MNYAGDPDQGSFMAMDSEAEKRRRADDRTIRLRPAAAATLGGAAAGGPADDATPTAASHQPGPDLPARPPSPQSFDEDAAFLLDFGSEGAALVVGAEVQPLQRGEGGPDLLRRAEAATEAWQRERVRTQRRLELPRKLLAFSEQLSTAETPAEVCRTVVEHVVHIVGAYSGVLLLREGPRATPRTWTDSARGRAHRSLSFSCPACFEKPGLVLAGDPGLAPGGPLAGIAPLFAATGAAMLAYVPFDTGAIVLAERRSERVFEAEDWDLFGAVARQGEASLRRARLYEQVRDLSLTDPLTGLANRRRMGVVLDHARNQGGRGQNHTLVLLDLDGFKQINDRDGHLAGDQLLSEVAECLRRETRGSDLLVRYGGDEFLMLLPDCDEPGAEALLERIRARLAGRVRFSAGIAAYDPEFSSAEAWIAAADQRLYDTKRARLLTSYPA